jgi:hypothetical protein
MSEAAEIRRQRKRWVEEQKRIADRDADVEHVAVCGCIAYLLRRHSLRMSFDVVQHAAGPVGRYRVMACTVCPLLPLEGRPAGRWYSRLGMKLEPLVLEMFDEIMSAQYDLIAMARRSDPKTWALVRETYDNTLSPEEAARRLAREHAGDPRA